MQVVHEQFGNRKEAVYSQHYKESAQQPCTYKDSLFQNLQNGYPEVHKNVKLKQLHDTSSE